MLINIKDAPEKAQRIFVQLIDIFEEQEINPTPLNYYIWYQYYKGDHPKFRQEMDNALQDPFGYNDRLGRRLYDEYFAEDESGNDFDRAFKRLINLVIKKMNVWSDKLEKHTQDLNHYTTSLASNDIDAATLKELTHSVLNTASSMKQSSEEFQKEMMDSNEEILQLRKELIEARAETLTDELTEIGNRKAFNNAIQDLADNTQENPQSLVLILTDIDHFKRFNDTFGHLVGDSVLRYFANLMKKTKDDTETVCRYGGEEFAILLSHSSLEKAKERAESIRHNLETAKLKRKDSEKTLGAITASFGVAAYQGEGVETIEEWINRADDALYKAKNLGRNQIVSEEELAKS
ncbi:GGDEF domain-containing protein [Hydrogenovibrio sp. 3SP14C1]|uniref:GGDEF domain-containing protein n=1 Tax=Hydrogenovibrio sp. 3SP14C1 TaxID=3038774 RepID=UPI002415D29B|nr:GGDEF domain-containing protein [Hydrogenovibrio sp. 3SP14C1]MDG4813227.1 GGDEF domain-containing protein [Hydrogenovibrio sp. 3SP14C1]